MRDTNIYIMSLEARYILNSMEKDKEEGYITKGRKFSSLFCGSLPYSNVTFNSNIKEAEVDENGEKKLDYQIRLFACFFKGNVYYKIIN